MSFLTNKQRALAVLLGGGSNQEAAASANVRAETVSRWKRHDPDFMKELAAGHAESWAETKSNLLELEPLAISAIERGLTDESTKTRLSAAKLYFSIGRGGTASTVAIQNNVAVTATPTVGDELTLEEAIEHIEASQETLREARACGLLPPAKPGEIGYEGADGDLDSGADDRTLAKEEALLR